MHVAQHTENLGGLVRTVRGMLSKWPCYPGMLVPAHWLLLLQLGHAQRWSLVTGHESGCGWQLTVGAGSGWQQASAPDGRAGLTTKTKA